MFNKVKLLAVSIGVLAALAAFTASAGATLIPGHSAGHPGGNGTAPNLTHSKPARAAVQGTYRCQRHWKTVRRGGGYACRRGHRIRPVSCYPSSRYKRSRVGRGWKCKRTSNPPMPQPAPTRPAPTRPVPTQPAPAQPAKPAAGPTLVDHARGFAVDYGKAWPYYRVDGCYWISSAQAQCAMTVWELHDGGSGYCDPAVMWECRWISPPDEWYTRTGTVTATLYQGVIYRNVQGFVAGL